jgi:hypothetical protein
MLVTNLGNGETLGVGTACTFAWATSMAAAFAPETLAEAADSVPGESEASNGEPGRASARRPRTRAARPTVVPDGANNLGAAKEADDAAADER